ncbi:cytochrome b [Acuticoccus mangrovi]|uniref:Cytochrome b n=1 Tax=Acuticoccus mangrovi TaxID=2796142 RepID=A0A934IGB0_9HYPH|nr:cytochrome b [Acuticoccus mangrovi]MBJ3776149.1 cytochrome b [Acuticoccus mangrovi]
MISLLDSPSGYGLVSRGLHWGMALVIAWQFTSAVLRVVASDTPVEEFFWSTHYSVGFTILLLVLVRGLWGLANLARRPRTEGPALQRRLAGIAHLVLYGLMAVVPVLAIARAAGSGRGLRVFGVELIAGGGERVPQLMAPANLLHGNLGWLLLALIAGHTLMALYHGLLRADPTLDRMTKGWSDKGSATA